MAQRIRVTHLLLAGGLVLAAQPAFAQEGMLFKNLFEGTFGGKSGDDIDYRARAPLVVPPNSALPAPQQSASSRNAAWPKDQDIERRREDRAASYAAAAEKSRNNPVLSQEELRRGRTLNAAPNGYEEQSNYNTVLAPIRQGKELAARRNLQAEEETLTYGSEPQRKLLTEPPTGYRRPAATAAIGPGKGGPVEDKQAVGVREFATGQGPVMQQ